MLKKRKSTVLLWASLFPSIAFYSTFLAVPVSGEILSFGPKELPNCAYTCNALYAAQFDCPDNVQCFCLSSHVGRLLGQTWACDEECENPDDRAAVKGWFDALCAKFIRGGQQGQPPDNGGNTGTTPNQDGGGNSKGNNGATPTEIVTQDTNQASRAAHWWHKNWYWFLVAFLMITLPIIGYALFFPIRKRVRQKKIQRRQRLPLPPLDTGGHLQEQQQGSKGEGILQPPLNPPPPIPEGAFVHAQYADPYSPVLTKRGFMQDGVAVSPMAVGRSEVSGSGGGDGGRDGYGGHVDRSGGLSSEEKMAVDEAVRRGTVRQSSWERRVREEYDGRKGRKGIFGSLGFWKTGGGGRGGRGSEGRREEKVDEGLGMKGP